MKLRLTVFMLASILLLPVAVAETVSCPDLSSAVQVAACPTEEDLKFTFNGYCSDNKRIYDKDSDLCTDYQRYRKVKNVALWESGDGVFQAYVSCDLLLADVKAAKAASIAVSKKGGISRLACSYGDGITFTNRTRAECRIDEIADCGADASVCKAVCE